jgi:hypothetical protein
MRSVSKCISALYSATFLLSTAALCIAQDNFATKAYTVPRNVSVRSADFNKDNRSDLLLSGGSASGTVVLNDGNGGFLAPFALPGTGILTRAQVADMNNDGFPDIVACVSPSGSTQANLDIYLNDGTGHFTIAQTTPVLGNCTSVNAGDVNLDGHMDVVTTSVINGGTPTSVNNNIFETFFGSSTGHVGAPVIQQNVILDSTTNTSDTNCAVVDSTAGNFYLDNHYSLIANTQCMPIGQTPSGDLGTTFLAHGDNTGHYTFTFIRQANEYLSNGHTFDLNKDGRPDALFVSTTGQYGSSLYYAQNNGAGSFTFNNLANDYNNGQPAYQYVGVTSADFNGDGFNDVATSYTVLANNGSSYYADVTILNGSSTGAFTQSQTWVLGDSTTANIGDLIAADFNGDGKPDLAVLSYNPSSGVTTLYIYTNTLGTGPSCVAPTQTNTNIICTPAKGSTVGSSFTITGASNVPNLTLNRLYLNNVVIYNTPSSTVETQIATGDGPQTLVLVSYNNIGQAFTSTSTFTVGKVCLPSASGVAICDPAPGETTTSTVTITAGATAAAGNITAIRAYIDNVAVATVFNPSVTKSFQMTQVVNAMGGSHRLVVVGYESTGAAVTGSETFTVNPALGCYPASTGVKICSPGPNAVVTSPFQVSAGATAGSGYITAIRVYVDAVAQATVKNPQQSKSFVISQPLSLSPGVHNMVVVGYQSTGGSVSASDNFRSQ